MGVRTYDPAAIALNFAGIPITGFADGTFVTAERDEDTYTKHVGAAGEVARTRNRNRSGSITFTLMATSPCNDLLSARARLDELTNGGTGSAQIKDLLGSTLVNAADAWIKKQPATAYAKEMQNREWTLDCADLDQFIGGTTLTIG